MGKIVVKGCTFVAGMYNYLQHIRTSFIIRRKQIIDQLSLNRRTDYTSFVILCEPRSGSTVLHTYLNSHPQIMSFGEILRENTEKKSPAKDPLSHLVFKPHAQAILAVGLKLFYEYFDDARFADDFNVIITQPNIKVIHLTRKDRMKQYRSLKIAEATNVWSTNVITKKMPDAIELDLLDYQHYLDKSESLQASILRLFAEHDILDVTYEDLTSETDLILTKIQNFLNVPVRKLFTLLKKQNND